MQNFIPAIIAWIVATAMSMYVVRRVRAGVSVSGHVRAARLVVWAIFGASALLGFERWYG
ncbi:hypothetical protein [Pseudoduganella sp. R-34]|uniref:hypothetical protein n=1 Tax=Pseudoduganella sp. R-34 TaxID=3404062 RepID=UPI003CEF9057